VPPFNPNAGKLADPEWRRARAQRARAAQTTVDYHIQRLLDAAPPLTAEQIARLRVLLVEPGDSVTADSP
jgi:hypothetical protein